MDSEERHQWSQHHHAQNTLQRSLDDTNKAVETLSRQVNALKTLNEDVLKVLKYSAAIQRNHYAITRRQQDQQALEKMKEKEKKHSAPTDWLSALLTRIRRLMPPQR